MIWLRGVDSNYRPPGYGPGKLPLLYLAKVVSMNRPSCNVLGIEAGGLAGLDAPAVLNVLCRFDFAKPHRGARYSVDLLLFKFVRPLINGVTSNPQGGSQIRDRIVKQKYSLCFFHAIM